MTNQNSKLINCQNCQNQFIIEPKDFEFYSKIKVPPPTFCLDCRLQRRLAWRNERTLYKRKCDAPGHNEDIISIYPPKFSGEKFRRVNHKDSPFKVYDQKYWWSDDWDQMAYSRDYDWNKPFFEQFWELEEAAPRASIVNVNPVNSEYINYTTGSKNCYLMFMSGAAGPNEDCLYSYRMDKDKECVDCSFLLNSQMCYEVLNSNNCYKLFWSAYCDNCIDSYFLYNCKHCTDCFGCVNLRTKQFNIFNKQYSKEEYFEKIKEFNLGGYKKFLDNQNKFNDFIKNFPRKYSNIIKSHNITGDDISNSRNCFFSFYLNNSENSKFVAYGPAGIKDSYDIFAGNGELLYESWAILANSYRVLFSCLCVGDKDIFYSKECFSSFNLFGCVGLRHKQYCILNKQYTKEEYESLVPKIIRHMNDMPYVDKRGRVYKYGEFFPIELSPFSYNETVAHEYFPLTKEETIEKGYNWKEPEERNVKIQIINDKLLDHIKDIDDSILGQVIECQHQGKCSEQCAEAFKIIELELAFYRKMNLPLPRLCPNCRHYQRIKQRNPLKLWHRKCQCAGTQSDNKIYQNAIEHSHKQEHCLNEFETPYSPDRKEIVYCEKCYLAEVV